MDAPKYKSPLTNLSWVEIHRQARERSLAPLTHREERERRPLFKGLRHTPWTDAEVAAHTR